MPVPIGLPGLDNIIAEVPDGRLLVVEGGTDPTKSYFTRHLAGQAADAGRLATFMTSRGADEVHAHFERRGGAPDLLRAHEAFAWKDIPIHLDDTGDLVIDSFSFLALEATRADLARWLRGLRAAARSTGKVVVLGLDRGMLDPSWEALTHHLADGILQFDSREDAEGLVQYVRIPRWMDDGVHTRNVYYGFDGKRILIDTRNRVN